MAIYSCNISNVSRAKGSSSCAALAYISGEEVENELTGQIYKYGNQDRIIETGTIIPQFAPPEYQDPKKLFNAIEKFETASNARTAKKIMVALPREFSLERQKEAIESYIKENITPKGYACTYAIHHDKNGNNPHCHILIANRPINEKSEWSIKSRKEYAVDANNARIPQLDQNGNQKLGKRNERLWRRVSVQINPLDTKDMLEQLRERWASECNKHLIPEQQIDHRSYAELGKEEEPTIHEGYMARKIEAQGGVSERCEMNRQITERNNLLKQIQVELKGIEIEMPVIFEQIEQEKQKTPPTPKITHPPRTLSVVSRERNEVKEKLDEAQKALNYAEYLESRIKDLNEEIKECDEIIESKGYRYYNKRAFGLTGKLPFGEGQKWRNEEVAYAIERKNKPMNERKELVDQFKKSFGKPYKERSMVFDRLNEMIKAYRASYKKLDNEWQPLASAQRLVEQKEQPIQKQAPVKKLSLKELLELMTQKQQRTSRYDTQKIQQPEKYRSRGPTL